MWTLQAQSQSTSSSAARQIRTNKGGIWRLLVRTLCVSLFLKFASHVCSRTSWTCCSHPSFTCRSVRVLIVSFTFRVGRVILNNVSPSRVGVFQATFFHLPCWSVVLKDFDVLSQERLSFCLVSRFPTLTSVVLPFFFDKRFLKRSVFWQRSLPSLSELFSLRPMDQRAFLVGRWDIWLTLYVLE